MFFKFDKNHYFNLGPCVSEIEMSNHNFLFLDNPPTYQEAGCASTQSKTTSPEEVDLLL